MIRAAGRLTSAPSDLVVLQEDVLEVLLAGANRAHLVLGRGLHHGVGGALESHGHGASLGMHLRDAGQRAKLGNVDRLAELDLEALDGNLAKVLERVDDDQPALAKDRQTVGDALDLRQRVRRQEHRAALGAHLSQQRVEALLDERIQPGDRFVQDQQLGLVHEGLDQADLLPVPGRQVADGAIDIGAEPLDQRVAHARIDPTPQFREVVEHGASGQFRIQREVAGQKTDAAADLEAVVDGVEPEHLRRARRRPDQIQEQAHRRRLAGAVRPEEAEHLSLPNLEVEPEQPATRAEVLRQAARRYRRAGAHDAKPYSCDSGGS